MRNKTKLRKWGFLVLFLIFSLSVFLGGETPVVGSEKSIKTVRFLCMAGPAGRKYTTVFKEFEKYGMRVIVDQVPWTTYLEKASLAVQAPKSRYDVIDANVEWVLPGWVVGNKVFPLNEFVEKTNFDLNDFFPLLLANVYWDKDQKYKSDGLFWDWENGLLYAIPSMPGTTPLCYRKDWFAEAGIPGPPKSWDEFLTYAKKLTVDLNGDGTIDRWGYAYASAPVGGQLTDYWMLFLRSWGASIFDEQFEPAFNNKKGIEATQFMVDLYRKYKVVPPGVPTYGIPQAFDAYKKGKVAMCTQWANALASVEDPSESVAVGKTGYAIPPIKEQMGARVGNFAYAIPVNVPDPELSWKFIQLASSYEVQKKLLPEIAASRKSVLDYIDEYFADTYLVPMNKIMLGETAALKPQIPNILEVDADMAYPVYDAITGKTSVKEALKEAERKVYETMKKAGFYK